MRQRILLAHSGGSAQTTAIPRLAKEYGGDVVTLTVDLGQDVPLDQVRDSALAHGAVRAHVIDARAEFARDYVLPALHSGTVYDGEHLRAAVIGLPLIATKLIEIAGIEQADIIACGSSALEQAVREIAPRARVVSTMTPGEPPSTAASHARHIPLSRVHDLPAHVAIAFEYGVPVSINGVTMDPIELLESIATIAAGHGVGVAAGAAENAERTICEAPAAIVLQTALRALSASIAKTHERVTGVVRLMLSKGACTVEGVEAPGVSTLAMVAEPL